MARQRKRVINGITVDPDMPHTQEPQHYFDNIDTVEIMPQEAYGLLPFTKSSKQLGGGVLLDTAMTPKPDFPEYDATVVNTLARLGFDIMSLTAYNNPVTLGTSPDNNIYFYNTTSPNGEITHNLLFPEWIVGTGGTIITPPAGSGSIPTTPPIPPTQQFPPSGDPPTGTVIIDPPYSGGQTGTPTGAGSTRPNVGTPSSTRTPTGTGYDVKTECFLLRPTLYSKSGIWVQEYKHSIRNAIDNAIRSVEGDLYHSPRQLIGVTIVAGGYIVTQVDFKLNVKYGPDGSPLGESPPPSTGVGSGTGGGTGSISLPPVKDGNLFLPVLVADTVGYSNCPPDFINVPLNPFIAYFGEFAFPVTGSVTGDIWAGLQDYDIGGDPPLSSNIRANDVNVTLAAAVLPFFKLFLKCYQIRLYPKMDFFFSTWHTQNNVTTDDTGSAITAASATHSADFGNPPPSFGTPYFTLTGPLFPSDDLPNSLELEFDYILPLGEGGTVSNYTMNVRIGGNVEVGGGGEFHFQFQSNAYQDLAWKHTTLTIPLVAANSDNQIRIYIDDNPASNNLHFDNMRGTWRYAN